MGKSARNGVHASDQTAKDVKAIRRALTRLGVPNSLMAADVWDAQVRAKLGDAAVDEFLQAAGRSDFPGYYDLVYSSFDAAMNINVGSRSQLLEVELAWVMGQLRLALGTVNGVEPLLLEVGSGAGVASAIVSRELRVPVIAVDSHPLAESIARAVADRLGAHVDPRTGTIKDLPEILLGRQPTAVFALSTIRHIQPHKHPTGSVSPVAAISSALTRPQPTEEMSLLLLCGSGPIIMTESACPDYLAELEACGGFVSGHHLDVSTIIELRGYVTGRETRSRGAVLTTSAAAPNAAQIAGAFGDH